MVGIFFIIDYLSLGLLTLVGVLYKDVGSRDGRRAWLVSGCVSCSVVVLVGLSPLFLWGVVLLLVLGCFGVCYFGVCGFCFGFWGWFGGFVCGGVLFLFRLRCWICGRPIDGPLCLSRIVAMPM